MIAIIDYGAGNLGSVYKAFKHIGADAVVTADADAVARADRLVLPGVGAFGHCMAGLARVGLADATREYILSGRPFLGICVGLQMLFDKSEEGGSPQGLGVLPGRVVRFAFGYGAWQTGDGGRMADAVPSYKTKQVPNRVGGRGGYRTGSSELEVPTPEFAAATGTNDLTANAHRAGPLKVPHIGWNSLSFSQDARLFKGLRQGDRVYFVHSYYPEPADPACVSATTEYGYDFCCAVERDNVYATQFHPEKSGEVGLQILRNFATLPT